VGGIAKPLPLGGIVFFSVLAMPDSKRLGCGWAGDHVCPM